MCNVHGVLVSPTQHVVPMTMHEFCSRFPKSNLAELQPFDGWVLSMLVEHYERDDETLAPNAVATSLYMVAATYLTMDTSLKPVRGHVFLVDEVLELDTDTMRDLRQSVRSLKGEQCRVCPKQFPMNACVRCQMVQYCSDRCRDEDAPRHLLTCPDSKAQK